MKRTPGSPLFQEWVLRETGPEPRIVIKGTHGRGFVGYSQQKRDQLGTEEVPIEEARGDR